MFSVKHYIRYNWFYNYYTYSKQQQNATSLLSNISDREMDKNVEKKRWFIQILIVLHIWQLITSLKDNTLRKINVRPYGLDKMYMDKELKKIIFSK